MMAIDARAFSEARAWASDILAKLGAEGHQGTLGGLRRIPLLSSIWEGPS